MFNRQNKLLLLVLGVKKKSPVWIWASEVSPFAIPKGHLLAITGVPKCCKSSQEFGESWFADNNAVGWLASSRLVFSRLQVKVIRKLHLRLKVAILFGSNIVWSDKKVSAAFDCLFPELRIIQIETTRNGFCKNSESLTSKSKDPSSIHNLLEKGPVDCISWSHARRS